MSQTRPADSEIIIKITPDALNEIRRLMTQEAQQSRFLRVGIEPGGCSGMTYSLTFDTERTEHDREFDYDGVRVVVDNRAVPYLISSTLHYKGGLIGGGFHFENPNAKRSCGCGSSFVC